MRIIGIVCPGRVSLYHGMSFFGYLKINLHGIFGMVSEEISEPLLHRA